MFLSNTYFPPHNKNRMHNEGDVKAAREYFFKYKPSNLKFLLSNRYSWMNFYTNGKKDLVEIGAGAGFSKEFIKNPNLILTDYMSQHDWIQQNVDALNMPYADNSLDLIISSHMIHHLATPVKFFREMQRVLKPNGFLVIQEINTSWFLRILLRIMRHEGWSYDVDVFDEKTIANQPEDPWSANCAIPELLFSDVEKFQHHFPGLKIIKNELCECFTFVISGGVIAKSKTINLPYPILRFISAIDSMLVKLFPRIFACGRKVVIQKL